MKIAIITDSIERGPTSVGNYTKNLVKELLKIKDVEIILIHGQKSDDLVYKGVKEIVVPFPKRRRGKSFFTKGFYFIFNKIQGFLRNYKIKKICESKRVNILHVPHVGRNAPSLAYMNGIKLVVTNHGMANLALPAKLCWGKVLELRRWIYWIEYIKWKIFISKIAWVITVSYSEKKLLLKKIDGSENKITPIYHGVDHEKFKVLKNKNKIEKFYQKYKINYDFLLHVSVYQPKKNVERIIKAFAITKKKYKIPQKLLIIGKHPNSVRLLVQKMGLNNEIIFLGFITHKELPFFYNTATAFIFPSLHESFGMPILEAMACSCPVITSNVFSCPEVAGDVALLVDPYNVEEIAEAIYKVVFDEKLREELKQKGLRRAQEFTWEKCTREHLKVYKEVMK